MSRTVADRSSGETAAGAAVRAARRPASPRIVGVGTAVPATRWRQEDLAAVQGELWGLRGAELDRWRRIVERSGVEHRAIVDDPHDLPGLSTARRMERFEAHAPGLAQDAAARALAAAGLGGGEVTDLVVATCTGFAAPGVGSSLIGGRVGLRREVRPLQLGFMGCFGGVAALRTARAIAGDDPDAVVLALCVELCSLHLRSSTDPQNLVASALFADGAAAVVVRGGAESGEGRGIALGRGRSEALPEHREEMTWRITDEGFAMTLSREVPLAIRRSLGGSLPRGARDLGRSCRIPEARGSSTRSRRRSGRRRSPARSIPAGSTLPAASSATTGTCPPRRSSSSSRGRSRKARSCRRSWWRSVPDS